MTTITVIDHGMSLSVLYMTFTPGFWSGKLVRMKLRFYIADFFFQVLSQIPLRIKKKHFYFFPQNVKHP
jgi:hypothetical protein